MKSRTVVKEGLELVVDPDCVGETEVEDRAGFIDATILNLMILYED